MNGTTAMPSPVAGRVLVTGADGLLGTHTTRELSARGIEVVALVEVGRQPATIAGLRGVSVATGDLLDPDSLLAAIDGCDAVIHIAALTQVWPSRAPRYFHVNVDGTRNVVDAALARGVSRFVHVSSSNAFGYGSSKEQPGSEEQPWPGDLGMDYIRTKRLAHQLVLEAHAARGLPGVVICPAFMLGPYDSGPSSGQLLVAAWNNPPRLCPSGGKNFVYAGDVAVAACNALTDGRLGEAYICGGANLEFRELLAIIERVIEKRQARIRAPRPLVLAAGAAASLFGKVSGKRPVLSLPVARSSAVHAYYSSAKATRELRLPHTDIAVAVAKAFEWFAANGYLKDPRRLA